MKPISLCVLALTLAAPSLAHAQTVPNVWDSHGQFGGTVDRSGNLYGPDNRYLGQIEPPRSARPQQSVRGLGQGTTYSSPDRGLRQVDPQRNVYGANGQYLGQVDRNGDYYDAQGKFRGQLR